MFNLRISIVIAGIAFILSFLIGLISKVSMPMLLLRPVILAAAFFILSCIVYIIAKNFLPELLDVDKDEDIQGMLSGSRINIIEGDSSDTVAGIPGGNPPEASRGDVQAGSKQVFMGAQADDSEEGLGNISDLMGKFGAPNEQEEGTSLGMDHNAQDGYTVKNWEERSEQDYSNEFGGGASRAEAAAGPAVNGVKPVKTSTSADILPDLDSMAGAFLSNAANADTDTVDYAVSASSKKPSAAKATAWSGDFNAKDMAAGLRTILRKDKEG